MTVAVTAQLTSTGDLANPKTGDVLTLEYDVIGDEFTITPGSVTVAGTVVKVTGGPWTGTLPETFAAPTVTGLTLAKPFAAVAGSPNRFQATI